MPKLHSFLESLNSISGLASLVTLLGLVITVTKLYGSLPATVEDHSRRFKEMDVVGSVYAQLHEKKDEQRISEINRRLDAQDLNTAAINATRSDVAAIRAQLDALEKYLIKHP